MTSYDEYRQKMMTDAAFRNFIVRLIKEEMMHGVGRMDAPEHGISGIPPGWISYKEAARIVDYSYGAVRDAVYDGHIDALTFGRSKYIERTAWLRHVMSHGRMNQREKALALLGQEQMSLDLGMAANG